MAEVRRSSGSPTVRRRELGTLLRGLRIRRGLTVDQVSAELLCSPSKVSRMETGQRGATLRDVRDLCDLYGVTDATDRERLKELAREGKQQGWWQSLSLEHKDYVGLEQDATSLAIFQSAVVPGLFQVADYIRAIHHVGVPRLEESTIEERVEERHKRQQILDSQNPPNVAVILDEAVLHRPIGGPAVMEKQLRHLVDVTRKPNITIQVIAYSVGAHPALESNLTVLEFAGLTPVTVHSESVAGQLFIKKQQDLENCLLAMEVLRDLALGPVESVRLIEAMRNRYAESHDKQEN